MKISNTLPWGGGEGTPRQMKTGEANYTITAGVIPKESQGSRI